jgi:hypothetical protein
MLHLCNKCEERPIVKTFDGEGLCLTCTVDRLVEKVEQLSTAYISVSGEVRYEL